MVFRDKTERTTRFDGGARMVGAIGGRGVLWGVLGAYVAGLACYGKSGGLCAARPWIAARASLVLNWAYALCSGPWWQCSTVPGLMQGIREIPTWRPAPTAPELYWTVANTWSQWSVFRGTGFDHLCRIYRLPHSSPSGIREKCLTLPSPFVPPRRFRSGSSGLGSVQLGSDWSRQVRSSHVEASLQAAARPAPLVARQPLPPAAMRTAHRCRL